MEHLLYRIHGASILIQIRVYLDVCHGESGGFQKQADAGGDNALPNAGYNTCTIEVREYIP